MIVLEFKTDPNKQQILAIEEAIRITKFLWNKCLRYWEDNQKIKPYDLNKYTAVLAKEFEFADKLNSMARLASSERAALAIQRFLANNRLGRQHLKVIRQRKDRAVKTAGALVKSSDLVVYEDLKIKNLLKNRKLAKSISDASWSIFTEWIDYYAKLHGIVCVAVPPNYTSQDCSNCGQRVKKTLSQRTHKCDCGCELQRDVNGAKNILAKGLEMLGAELPNTVGRTEINAHGENPLYLDLVTEISKGTR